MILDLGISNRLGVLYVSPIREVSSPHSGDEAYALAVSSDSWYLELPDIVLWRG